jgi:hypothetical protein
MSATIASIGLFALIWLAVLVGASLDSEAQRIQWREVARERRSRNDEILRLKELLREMHDERRQLNDEPNAGPDSNRAPKLSADCPLRGLV